MIVGILYKTTTLNGLPISSHRKVWILANGPIPAGHHIHHINGDKLDNRLENLRCLSNAEHTALHGKGRPPPNKGTKYGETEGYRKSNLKRMENHVEHCRATYRLWKQGFTQQKVAELFGISRRQVCDRLRLLRTNGYVSD
jgi:hypothetical protein